MINKYLILKILFLNSFMLLLNNADCQVNPKAQISDSPSSIIGFNHIGISVQNLDEMVKFYQEATGFEIVKREKINHSKNASLLLGVENISYETVTFKAPNMLLELTEYSNQQNSKINKMPPQGPGMTHTCYQSPSWDSGYGKFKNADAEILSRGSTAVDLGGYGVTYAYAYDPEGNMLELEQLDKNHLVKDSIWTQSNPMWMTQVALLSPDLKTLVDYYRTVLEINPNREGSFTNNLKLDQIVDIDQVGLSAAWFIMDGKNKMLELMQYTNPITPSPTTIKHPTDLGYSFSFEVEDIQKEYSRLKKLGVNFISKPKILGEFWMVFANDPDGNIYSLRQPTSTASIYSINNFN